MTRLTINVDDELHRALKETAARTGRTIGSLIEEGLRLRGIQPMSSARDLVAKARQNADLSEREAVQQAVEETRLTRKQ